MAIEWQEGKWIDGDNVKSCDGRFVSHSRDAGSFYGTLYDLSYSLSKARRENISIFDAKLLAEKIMRDEQHNFRGNVIIDELHEWNKPSEKNTSEIKKEVPTSRSNR